MSIDNYYECLIHELTAKGKIVEISKKLLAQETNDQRVLYIYELIEQVKPWPELQSATKSETVSTKYRNHGNHCFQHKEDHKAWQYYNLSLLNAPLDSETYPVAIANRSAIFYSLKMYKECIQDIKEVMSMKYPEKLKDKLLKRLSSCEDYLKKDCISLNDEIDNSFMIFSGPRDPRYPCASSKLKVVLSKEMGRHVVAKENIKVGEILIEEEPYFKLPLKSQSHLCCSYCLSRNANLLPCHKCSYALYCSADCKNRAWSEYHFVECPLMLTLDKMEFTKLELLALRTVIKARNDHSDWQTLFDIVKKAESNMNTEFHGCVYADNKWVYDSKYYASIHTLATNIDKRSVSDIFQKSVTAAVFLHFLITYTEFLKAEYEKQDAEILKFVAGTLLIHIMSSPTNMHGLCTNVQSLDGSYVEEMSIASAPYAYHSLLNHSCAPNVVRFHKVGTGKMTTYAIRPIKKGMQVYDNYGPHHALQDRNSRQDSLKFQYKFQCFCEACVNDWPTYVSLKLNSSNVPKNAVKIMNTILDSDAIECLLKGDRGKALELFSPLCEMIEMLDPYAPCAEQADCQESMKQCLTIFKGLVPYGNSNLIDRNAVNKCPGGINCC